MPTAKQAAWIVALSLATFLGVEHYRSRTTPNQGRTNLKAA